MAKEQVKPRKDKRMLTLFIILVPSVLLAMTAAISNFAVRIGFQVVLLFFQAVLVKNLLDDYYGE